MHNKIMPIFQHVTPMDKLGILPPCRRPSEELPFQWRNLKPLVFNKVSSIRFKSITIFYFQIQKVYLSFIYMKTKRTISNISWKLGKWLYQYY